MDLLEKNDASRAPRVTNVTIAYIESAYAANIPASLAAGPICECGDVTATGVMRERRRHA